MPLPADLLPLLVCPKSRQPLVYFPRGERDDDAEAHFLFCPASCLRYRIEGDVPVLLVDEAAALSPGDAERLLARARLLGLENAA